MILEKIIVTDFFTNCYIIGSENLCGIIDTGGEVEKIERVIEKYKLKPIMIINTHGHFDHIGGNNSFNLPVYIHKNDFPLLKDPEKNLSSFFSIPFICENEIITLKDGDEIEIGKLKIKVIHTPGHTKGSICLKIEDILFSGDTVFSDGIGRTDFPEGDEEILLKSIKEKIFILPDSTEIYPGHGEKAKLKEIKEWLKL